MKDFFFPEQRKSKVVIKLRQTEAHLTRGQYVVSLQDACGCQIVDDVLETNVFEH